MSAWKKVVLAVAAVVVGLPIMLFDLLLVFEAHDRLWVLPECEDAISSADPGLTCRQWLDRCRADAQWNCDFHAYWKERTWPQ